MLLFIALLEVFKVLSQNIKNIGGDWQWQFQCQWLLVKHRRCARAVSNTAATWKFLNLMEAVCIILSKQNAGGHQETFSCARNIFISFLSLINISLFTGTQSMTKQVPSKHDTTRTVISILPLATFHQWLIKLLIVAPRVPIWPPRLCSYFFNSCSDSN